MRTDRLLIMIDYLKEVVAKRPRYKFKMSTWADDNFNPNECRTAGCAIGHAAADHLFNGLRLQVGNY